MPPNGERRSPAVEGKNSSILEAEKAEAYRIVIRPLSQGLARKVIDSSDAWGVV